MKPLLNITASELCSRKIVEWGHTRDDKAVSYHNYQNWLEKGRQGSLHYMTDKRALMRASLSNYYPAFQSALVFLFDYHSQRESLNRMASSKEANGLELGSYTLGFSGRDYHRAIREDLNWVGMRLKEVHKDLDFQLSLDVHPVLERDLAWRAGLGWIGKNSMLIHRKHGSFVMLGALLLNKDFFPDKIPIFETDHCGHCRLCVDACPTKAIDPETRTLTAQECISTFTIEHFKDDIPPPRNYHRKTSQFFGCDICQNVCPWNSKLLPLDEHFSFERALEKRLLDFFLLRPVKRIVAELASMSNKGFVRFFKETAFARTGRIGLLKNLRLFKS